VRHLKRIFPSSFQHRPPWRTPALVSCDSATHHVSHVSQNFCQLLHNSVGTGCTRNPEQIEVMKLQGYSRPTCNNFCASSHDALDRRRCNPPAPPSTSCVDHTIDSIDLSWRNFVKSRVWAKFQRKVPEIPEFPYNTVQDRSQEASMSE